MTNLKQINDKTKKKKKKKKKKQNKKKQTKQMLGIQELIYKIGVRSGAPVV